MFEGTDPNEVFRLLKENHINYVAIDDQIRKVRQFIKNPNEDLFMKNFQLVWEDSTGEYDKLKIYKVPDDFRPGTVNNPSGPSQPGEQPPPAQGTGGSKRFSGRGRALMAGQFDRPTRRCGRYEGQYLYYGHDECPRSEVSHPTASSFPPLGTLGDGDGQLKEPNGIILDKTGLDLRYLMPLITSSLKYDADGNFLKEWKNPGGWILRPARYALGFERACSTLLTRGTRV
jgi:hypothetical protein